MANLCKDCVHAITSGWLCGHLSAVRPAELNLVSGLETPASAVTCYGARGDESLCGVAGRYWEAVRR
jgi:hypothetical protein